MVCNGRDGQQLSKQGALFAAAEMAQPYLEHWASGQAPAAAYTSLPCSIAV